MPCETCESKELYWRWTDTHGVAVCGTCGTPYRLYHYENDKRVEKPPSPMLNERGMAIAKQYWQETKRRVFPASYDMGMERGGRTYSGATREDCAAFNQWAKQHPEHFPTQASEEDAIVDSCEGV